jgi:hypothetical protein
MLANTGTVSFILYGIFILIAIAGMAIAVYFIRRSSITASEQLDKIIELAKYTIVSVAIATVTLIITNLFKEREQDIKELEYFDKYVQDVKKVDGIQERFLLAKYLSIVAPSGELKRSWKEYHDTLNVEYQEYLRLKMEKEALDTLENPSNEDLMKKEQLTQKIILKEAPLVAQYSIPAARVYIHISDESQRPMAKMLQTTLIGENFSVPGIENVSRTGHFFIPAKTEVRYYREEELADANRLVEILKSLNSGIPVNEVPVKISGTGRGTRPGQFEIWFAKTS